MSNSLAENGLTLQGRTLEKVLDLGQGDPCPYIIQGQLFAIRSHLIADQPDTSLTQLEVGSYGIAYFRSIDVPSSKSYSVSLSDLSGEYLIKFVDSVQVLGSNSGVRILGSIDSSSMYFNLESGNSRSIVIDITRNWTGGSLAYYFYIGVCYYRIS